MDPKLLPCAVLFLCACAPDGEPSPRQDPTSPSPAVRAEPLPKPPAPEPEAVPPEQAQAPNGPARPLPLGPAEPTAPADAHAEPTPLDAPPTEPDSPPPPPPPTPEPPSFTELAELFRQLDRDALALLEELAGSDPAGTAPDLPEQEPGEEEER